MKIEIMQYAKTESTAAETTAESIITPEKADPLIDMIKQI